MPPAPEPTRTTKASSRLRCAAAIGVWVAVAQFAIVLGIAVVGYPGGHMFDPAARGHSFWLNTFCDLGRPVAVNGQANPARAVAFDVSLLVVLGALPVVWMLLPGLFGQERRARRLGRAATVLGVVSFHGGMLLAMGLLTRSGGAHTAGIAMGAGPGLAALALACVGLWTAQRRGLALWSAALLAIGLYHFGQFVAHFGLGVTWTPAGPAVQRVATLWALSWMVAVAAAVITQTRRKR